MPKCCFMPLFIKPGPPPRGNHCFQCFKSQFIWASSRILYQWNHTVCTFGNHSFTERNVFEIPSCCFMYQLVFFFLFIAEPYSIAWIYHRYLLTLLWMDTWAEFSFFLFWIKSLWISEMLYFAFIMS